MSVQFNPASPSTPAVPSANPKIGEHRSSPTYQVAKEALKPVNPATSAIIKAKLGKLSTRLLSLFQENILKIIPEKSQLAKSSPDERPIVAAKQLIASFTEEDKSSRGVFRLSAEHTFIQSAKESISKGKMPQLDKLDFAQKSNLLKQLLTSARLFDGESVGELQASVIPRLELYADDDVETNKNFVSIVAKMPDEKKELLRDLLNLCEEIKDRSSTNNMDLRNLARMIGPLLLPIESNSAVEMLQQVAEQEKLGTFLLSLDKAQREELFP